MRKLEDIFKAEWEPFVGPQGGKGWQNIETGQKVYGDEPPGEPSMPEGFDLVTDFDIADINDNDTILFGDEDGDVDFADPANVPANANVFGIVEETDREEVESDTERPDDARDVDEPQKDLFSNELLDTIAVETPTGVNEMTVESVNAEVEEIVVSNDAGQETVVRPDFLADDDGVSASDVEWFTDSQSESTDDGTPRGDDAVEYLERKTNYDFDERYDFDVTSQPASEYTRAIQEALSNDSVEDYDDDMSVTDALTYESEQTYLAAYVVDEVLQKVDQSLVENEFGDPEDVEGEIDEKQYHNIPEGTTVEVDGLSGSAAGEVTVANNYTFKVESADGEEHGFTVSNIESIEAHGTEDPENFSPERVLSDEATASEINEYADEVLTIENEPSHFNREKKSKSKRFLRETFQRDGDPEVVLNQLKDFGAQFKDLVRVSETLLDEQSFESDVLGREAEPTKDRNTMSDLKKLYRSFREEHDNMSWATETAKDAVSAASDWTGNSTNEKTAVMWAAANALGYDNVPDEIDTESVSESKVEDYQEWMEQSQEMVREAFGDEFTVYRGQYGGFGQDKAQAAKEDDGLVDTDHRAIASWSISPMVGKKFAGSKGAMWKKKMTPEDVMISMMDGAGFSYETELVGMAGRSEYEPLDDVTEAEEGIIPSENISEDESFVRMWEAYQEMSG